MHIESVSSPLFQDHSADTGIQKSIFYNNRSICVVKGDGGVRLRRFWRLEVPLGKAILGGEPRQAPDFEALGTSGSCLSKFTILFYFFKCVSQTHHMPENPKKTLTLLQRPTIPPLSSKLLFYSTVCFSDCRRFLPLISNFKFFFSFAMFLAFCSISHFKYFSLLLNLFILIRFSCLTIRIMLEC